jgi:trigger factor
MGRVQSQVEELAGDKVKLSVEVPKEHLRHAVDHAASDLAESLKIPGFRKGKVPMPVLIARVGKERIYAEAVESHIRGWFLNAAASARIRPVAQPEYEYELPGSADDAFSFTATVPVQPRIEVADWTQLEVPAPQPEVPAGVVDQQLEQLRSDVAELAPVEGRPAAAGDVVVIDLEAENGDRSLDTVVEVGSARLVDEIELALEGMAPGDTRQVEYEFGDEGEKRTVTVTVKEIKEKVLPPLDDELARTASEFDTLEKLRADVEGRIREQLEAELESEFRAEAADALAEASGVQPAVGLVRGRAASLARGLAGSLERRGVSLDTYLSATGQSAEQLEQLLVAQATQSLARELVLEAAADKLDIEVTDEDLEAALREESQDESLVEQVLASEQREELRHDLRLRHALDRVASEVKRIPVELAQARERLWTPEQEKPADAPKLWTPGWKEPE